MSDPRTFWNAVETLAQLGEGGLAEDLAKLGEAEEINQALSQVASSRGVTGGLRAAQGAAEQALRDEIDD